jgi:hypothetical protein
MRRRLIRTFIVTALVVPVFAFARLAGGVGASDFSGFDIASKATAAQWTFNSPSLGIPAEPTGELNFAFSESKLESGPSGYGLGSMLWPGQVAAALPVFLQGEFERQCQANGGTPEQCDLPTEIPNYPVRAESFHPQGPPQASSGAGTTHMRSNASESAAEGVAFLHQFAFPALGEMGTQSSFSTSGFDPLGAVAMAEAAANDISLFNGIIRFDSVVTRATARSDGVKGTVAGNTTITGASISGTDVVIDTEGVHIADEEGLGAAAAEQAVNGVLSALGISIELSKPVDTIQGPKATRALGGVIVRVKSSTLEPLLVALPDELESEIRGQLTFDQETTIQLAPAAVTAGAAKALEFEVPALPPVVEGTQTDAPTSPTTPTETTPTDDTTTTPTTGTPSDTGGTTVAAAPVNVTFSGVPVWLVVLLVIAAFVLSRPLTALADRVFAATAGGAGCPDET